MTAGPALRLSRWSVTSGSSVQSRGVVVIEAGDHHWRASAMGNGAVDALLRAVDAALADVLAGHPRLVAYDVHAVAQGPDAEGEASVTILPPEGAGGAREGGRFSATVRGTNIIAASLEAYIEAINAMLADASWADAPVAAGTRHQGAPRHDHRAELDAGEPHDPTAWFDR